MKKKRVLILLIVSLLLILTSCNNTQETSKTVKKEDSTSTNNGSIGGEIYLPLTNLESLNPLINQNLSYYHFNQLVFESLFELDDELNIEGNLAESYSLEDNGRTVKIKLKENVNWHDGEKFSADDVIFTIETIKSAGINNIYGKLLDSGLGSYSPLNIKKIIKASGEGNSLSISFDRPFSNNLEILTFPIIPKHIFKSPQDALKIENYPIVGTGPFKLKSYTKLKEIVLESNEDYREGRPYLDRVIGLFFDSQEDIDRAFEAGQVNLNLIKDNDLEKYNESKKINLKEFTSSNYEFLGFNFSKAYFQDEKGNHLRRAIGHAIDRELLLDKAYLGHGSLVELPLHPDSWLIAENTKSIKFDLKKAKKEMSLAGYKDLDSEGYFLDESGKRLKLELLTNSLNPQRMLSSEIIKRNLKEIGIEVLLKNQEKSSKSTSLEEIENQWKKTENEIRMGKFDLVLGGWDQNSLPDYSYMFSSDAINAGSNFIRYSNEETDKLLLEAFNASGSREEKKEKYEKLNENILENLPYLSLLYKKEAIGLDKRFDGDLKPSFYNLYKGLDKVFELEVK